MDSSNQDNMANDGNNNYEYYETMEPQYGQDPDNHQEYEQLSPLREQDRFLPIANVSKIMKKAVPYNGKISKEAKEIVQECVSEYISFITSEAAEKCQQEKRKTINGEDLLWAMSNLGFDQSVEPLRLFLTKYREANKLDSSMLDDGGGGLMAQQQQQSGGGGGNEMNTIYIRDGSLVTTSGTGGSSGGDFVTTDTVVSAGTGGPSSEGAMNVTMSTDASGATNIYFSCPTVTTTTTAGVAVANSSNISVINGTTTLDEGRL